MESLKIKLSFIGNDMRILQVDDLVIKQLRDSGISKIMKSLESCDWVTIEEFDNKIVGAAGMGGLFHISAIQILDEFQGKGIGKKLQKTVIEESKRRGYSFIVVYVDPKNKSSINLHISLGYTRIFRIHYSEDIVQDIMILIFKSRGKIIAKLLQFFNTKMGILLLGCLLKTFKFAFPSIILHNEDNSPKPNIRWILKNFEKV